MLMRVLNFLSSLRLTVTLLAFGIALVFLGTVAQEPMGNYLVQERFFKCFYVDPVALNAAFRKASHLVLLNLDPLPNEAYLVRPRIPVFPGGYLIGGMLLLNLLTAHARRLKFSWKKSGILMTHAGLIVMLLGQVFTDLLARESQISFREGETRDFSEDFAKYELVFAHDIPGTGREQVISVPESLLPTGGEVRNERLPFTIRIREFHANADLPRRKPMVDTNREPAASQGAGVRLLIDAQPEVRDMEHKNMPAAVVEIAGTQGSLGTWVLSPLLRSQEFQVGSETWRTEMRPLRYYEPFSVTLLKTTHEIYRGTDIPKNFQSRVRLDNPATSEHREIDIYMNSPLRYAGLTFYQYQMGREQLAAGGRPTSTLQVVRNPSWLTPYLSVGLVFFGLLTHFLIMLTAFIARSTKSVRPVTGT